jgi:hypothetical protein
MPAKISTKRGQVLGPYLKRTAELVSGAVGGYFTEAMPSTSSIAKEVPADLIA